MILLPLWSVLGKSHATPDALRQQIRLPCASEVSVRDILPDEVVDTIAGQYRSAAREAVQDFDGQQGDEDSLTGALGSVLRQHTQGSLVVDDIEYRWKTYSRKYRGRGKGAEEKRTGVDAVVVFEVWSDGELAAQKTMPVQSKKKWRGTDRKLEKQAQKIAKVPGGGIVIDYGPDSYSAVEAGAVAKAGGNRAKVPSDDIRELGDVLAGEFLECTIGSRKVYFDAGRSLLLYMGPDAVRATPIRVDRRVLTKVAIRPSSSSPADEPLDEP